MTIRTRSPGLKSALLAAKGKSVFVETSQSSFGGDHRDRPREDWEQKRLGPNPPESLVSLHGAAAEAVLSAVGLDPVLAGFRGGDGTMAREAYRRFERLVVQPSGPDRGGRAPAQAGLAGADAEIRFPAGKRLRRGGEGIQGDGRGRGFAGRRRRHPRFGRHLMPTPNEKRQLKRIERELRPDNRAVQSSNVTKSLHVGA